MGTQNTDNQQSLRPERELSELENSELENSELENSELQNSERQESRLQSPQLDPELQQRLVQWSARFEGREPAEILAFASEHFGSRLTFATGFGVEGCLLLDLVGRHQLPIDLFTLDTGLLFPETYELWRRLEDRYDLRIRAVKSELSLHHQAQIWGERLWERESGRCCELRKVQPLRSELAGFSAWITAIRRDQTPERAKAQVFEWDAKFSLVKVNPLLSWSSKEVWREVVARDIPYNPLHDQNYPSIGCEPCTSPVKLGEDPRAGRWRQSGRRECGLHSGEEAPSLSSTLASPALPSDSPAQPGDNPGLLKTSCLQVPGERP